MKEDKQIITQHVLDLVRMIPKGRITSYGAIAKSLGTPRSARIVGWVLGHSKFDKDVPAHRVVNRNGLLTGKHHFTPPDLMQQLLEQEGVCIKEDKVENFSNLFWDPMKNIEL